MPAKCIMVQEDNGVYQHIGSAEVEDWQAVQDAADTVERIESLTGWGEYTAAYRVTGDAGELVYFVAE